MREQVGKRKRFKVSDSVSQAAQALELKTEVVKHGERKKEKEKKKEQIKDREEGMLSFMDKIKLRLHSLVLVYRSYFRLLSKDTPVSSPNGVA